MLVGVNLSGAEFGDAHRPGVYDTDYTYPTHAEIDYFASKGMGVIRLAFLWERLQRTPDGPLDARELARMDDVVRYATSKGIKVILDPHNYGYGFGHEIGSAETTNAEFANFWGRVAGHYKSNENVIFGLMNEPHDQTAREWLSSVNAAIAAIRATGARQEILVPGTAWDTASLWTTSYSGNAAVIGTGIRDPLNNYAFEVHQYLDSDETGRHANVVSTTIGVERLEAVTRWAEAHDQRLFLGEIGVATDARSLRALDNTLEYMNEHEGVWQGVTYFAAGPWWGDYMFSVEPNGLGTGRVTDMPQMHVLTSHNTHGQTAKNYSSERENLTIRLSAGTADGPAGGDFGHQTFRGIDNVTAGSGDDRIYGNGHANALAGGRGDDTLTGAGGSDRFVFQKLADSTASSAGRDTIKDFSRAQHDRIDLRGIDANTHAGGNQSFHLIGSHGFDHHAGELQARSLGANTLVSGDVTGDGRADFAILLTGHIALHSGDFLL